MPRNKKKKSNAEVKTTMTDEECIAMYGMTEEERKEMLRAAAPNGINCFDSDSDSGRSVEDVRGSPSTIVIPMETADNRSAKFIAQSVNTIAAHVGRNDVRNAVKAFLQVPQEDLPSVWLALEVKTRRIVWLRTAIANRLKLVRTMPDLVAMEMLEIIAPCQPEQSAIPRNSPSKNVQTDDAIAPLLKSTPSVDATVQISQPLTTGSIEKTNSKTVRLNLPTEQLPALWSRIVNEIPTAEIQVVRPGRAGVAITLTSAKDAEALSKMAKDEGQLVMPPPKKHRVVLTNFDSAIISESLLREKMGSKIIRAAKLPSKTPNRGDQILLETTDQVFAEELVTNGYMLQPLRLRFRHFFEKKPPLQCFRCQGYGHLARDCETDIRCLRCGEQHPAQNCPFDKSHAKCCNCDGQHPANSSKCPARPKG